jgi:ribonuclease R
MDLATRILSLVNMEGYRPSKPRVIAQLLDLSADERLELKRTIKRMVRSGLIVYGANHLLRGVGGNKPTAALAAASEPTAKDAAASDTAASEDAASGASASGEADAEVGAATRSGKSSSRKLAPGEIVGTFRRAAAGYGFVRPQGTAPSRGRDDDIFVPVDATRDAASGDLVRVAVRRRGFRAGRARATGEITGVLRRAASQFVGTYDERRDVGWVQIDGTDFGGPIRVGDRGAKGAKPDDKVVVEIVRYPTAVRPGEAVITEVLGASGEAGVDTLTIMRQYELPERFPEEVLAAAREEAARFDGSLQDGRRDLTDLVVVTIDPVDARDFDDAISLERLENGHWRLGVHIADVSHFVRPNTPLDREARDRATSVYLPDRVIPMLPEVISNHLASLQPNEVRFTKSAFIEFTAEGARVATDFCTGAIRSRRRFSYEEVDQFLGDKMGWRIRLGPEVFRLVEDMHRLAMVLRRRRLERGSIEMNMPEIKLRLDRQGRVAGAAPVPRTESHQVIEEFMLAANEAVAERLHADGIAFLRRVHESPDPMKIDTLTDFVRELGIDCENLQNRFEMKRVLAEVAGQPLELAVNYATLRAMQKAVYSPEEVGHYALAFQDYCHFTSPIRRYPDLTIHRLMETIFQGRRPSGDLQQLASLGEHCSQREQRAESAERDLVKLKLLHHLADKVGETMDAVVTGVEDFGLFAQGIALPAEGLVPIRSLTDDHYRFDPDVHALVGFRLGNVIRLGDLLRVQIARVDLVRRELDFAVVQRLTHGEVGRVAGDRPKRSGDRDARGAGGPRRGKNRGKDGGRDTGRRGGGRSGPGGRGGRGSAGPGRKKRRDR